jgi:hypothetical protein
MTIKYYKNTDIIKKVYAFDSWPASNCDFVRNLGYYLGCCSWNNDTFTPYLKKLIKQGIITKVYDVNKSGYREALYEFSNGKGEIEFFGENHMTYTLTYSY